MSFKLTCVIQKNGANIKNIFNMTLRACKKINQEGNNTVNTHIEENNEKSLT